MTERTLHLTLPSVLVVKIFNEPGEAEQMLKKSSKTPRWMMKITKQDEKDREQQERAHNMQYMSKLKTRRGDRLEGIIPKTETADADDLDFDDDRFADDEEAPVMEGEEQENKEIEVRLLTCTSRNVALICFRNASKRSNSRPISLTCVAAEAKSRRTRGKSAAILDEPVADSLTSISTVSDWAASAAADLPLVFRDLISAFS